MIPRSCNSSLVLRKEKETHTDTFRGAVSRWLQIPSKQWGRVRAREHARERWVLRFRD